MKKVVIVLFLVLGIAGLSHATYAATRVRGYFRNSGTYVMPHYRSSPNSYRFDNYSMRGNYNPYTGKKGYANPYRW